MAESSGFFPSVSSDREYTSSWLAQYIAAIISNGTYDGELAVTADGSAMSVTLPTGRAWINGYYYRNDGDLTLSIDNADGVLNRIDIVVLRWDVNERSITAQIIEGTKASTATSPAITRTAEQYDLKLAEISIPAGTTAITQSLITDYRPDESVCGIVAGVVQQLETATYYQQFTDAFNTWFQAVKDTLGTDAAGNLQNEVDAINALTINGHTLSGSPVLTKSDIGLSNVDNTADANKTVNKAGYATGLDPATAPCLVNILVLPYKDSDVPAGLPDGTIVFWKDVASS